MLIYIRTSKIAGFIFKQIFCHNLVDLKPTPGRKFKIPIKSNYDLKKVNKIIVLIHENDFEVRLESGTIPGIQCLSERDGVYSCRT